MTSLINMSFGILIIIYVSILTGDATVIHGTSTTEIKTTTEKECDCGENSVDCVLLWKTKTKRCYCKEGYVEYKTYYQKEPTCKKCDCGLNAVSCKYDNWGDKSCTCQDGYDAAYGNIEELTCKRCDCGANSASCKFEPYTANKVCKCKEGYSWDAEEDKCKVCDCGYGGICSFLHGLKTCQCFDKYAEKNGRCEACDCGTKSFSCELKNGLRKCKCESGYAVLKKFSYDDETCEECDCGDGECEFDYGVKKCNCHGKLIEVNGKCEECDCGSNSISCKLDSMNSKRCTCKNGYAPSKPYSIADESCKECDCGAYGTSCSFETSGFNQIQTCECSYGGYGRTQEGKCKECDCGFNSNSCYFNSEGRRRCGCNDGYKADKDYSWEDEYCNYISTGRSGDISGWRVGTYIIAVIFAVIIIGLLIAIVNKKE